MTHDTEAAWPLTQPDQGYHLAPPSGPITPSPLVTTPNIPPQTWRQPMPSTPSTPSRPMPWGVKIAMLSLILVASVVLTGFAMTTLYDNILSLIVVWVGIVLVTAIVFSHRDK